MTTLEAEIDNIKTNMAKTIQIQSLLRVFEAKDRNIVERNFERINIWSLINVVVMLTVLFLQVFMIRICLMMARKFELKLLISFICSISACSCL